MGLSHMSRHRPPPVVEIKRNRDPERSKSIFEQTVEVVKQQSNRLVSGEPDSAIAEAFKRAALGKLRQQVETAEERTQRKNDRLALQRAKTRDSQAQSDPHVGRAITEEQPMDTMMTEEKPHMPDWHDLAHGRVKVGEKYIAPDGSVLVAGEPLPPELAPPPPRQLGPVTDVEIAEADRMAQGAKDRRLMTKEERRAVAEQAMTDDEREAQEQRRARGVPGGRRSWANKTEEERAAHIAKMIAGRAKARQERERERGQKAGPAGMSHDLAFETERRQAVGLPPLGRLMFADERKECSRLHTVFYNRRYREQVRAGLRPAPSSLANTVGKPARHQRTTAPVPPAEPAAPPPMRNFERPPQRPAAAAVPALRHDVEPFEEWAAPRPVGIEIGGVRYQSSFEIEDDVPMPPPKDMVVWPFTGMRVGQSFKLPIDHRGGAAIEKQIQKMAAKLAPDREFYTAQEPGYVRCWRRA